MPQLSDLLKIIKKNNPQADTTLVELAYDFAYRAHEGQMRKSGEPYINHPLGVAITLAQLKTDLPTIIAGLLHDVTEETKIPLKEIKKEFGEEVASLVAGITKLGKLKYRGIERYAENLRKMFIAMSEDLRVIVIKLADRLNNLGTLWALPHNKQSRIARETLEIYSAIANRLGMGQLKGQLEDLAFPYVYPEDYKWLTKILPSHYHERENYLNGICEKIVRELKTNGIKLISYHGRAKHLYSLYKKLLRPEINKDLEKIYDLIALRIIVKTVSDCYATLGIIHKLWRPLPGRIKDYIAQPKPNGYQSLHTTVWADNKRVVEFQIRTKEMHEEAEFGIATHLHYEELAKPVGEKKKKEYEVPKQLAWIQELLKWQKQIKDSEKYLETIKLEVFPDHIFVFTPKGDVIDLPEGATPIDFAYHIHTDVGNHCVGAKVNEKLVSLDTPLKSGDVVEIMLDKSRKAPSPDWLKLAKTSMAKNKIRSQLKWKDYLSEKISEASKMIPGIKKK